LGAHLERADLSCGRLERAKLYGTDLKHAILIDTNLKGATFRAVNLEGARFKNAAVSGATLVTDDGGVHTDKPKCDVDRKTDFRNAALANARIDAGLRQRFEYNARRMNWEDWYGAHSLKGSIAKWFWHTSDYGSSTYRIVGVFSVLALVFACIYWVHCRYAPPGIVTNLFQDSQGPFPCWLVFIRSLYFSVVTMTTLGFGDIYAQPRSVAGHVSLTFQVLLGYFLLGALVTRLSILFNSLGPSADYSKRKTEGHDEGQPEEQEDSK
jgi:ion channel/pentapeptide repeat protein